MENFAVTIERGELTIRQLLRIEEEAVKMNGGNINIVLGNQQKFFFNSLEAKSKFERWMQAYMHE